MQTLCKHCGKPIIFRKSAKTKDGKIMHAKPGGVLVIHLQGPCSKK